MRSKSSDRKIVLWLLAALIGESLLLLWHMDVISFSSASRGHGEKPAGQISRAENDLRRRSLNSLLWEKTATSENVYFYDSLLTLAQSTAKLKLEHGTEVELAENTLVTIEPQTQGSNGEIRLRFTRGSVQARNPFQAAKIDAPEFSLDVQAGSDLSLRQVADGQFEVRVEKGEARVESGGVSHVVNKENLVRIDGGEAKTLKMDQSIGWSKAPPRRVYTHEAKVDVELAWSGDVTELVVQKSGEAERAVATVSESMKLELNVGQYTIYPRAGDQTGPPIDVQVWSAPLLHLISPLPRNRVRTDETTFFLWTRIPEAESYGFRLESSNGDVTSEGEGNSFSAVFEDEADGQWGVWAKDKQGFSIPPLYRYPIYIRHAPLEAPKLKSPRWRQPASKKGAWYRILNELWPVAHAEEGFEAQFEWEAVEGATIYLIEISETLDFRNPVVSEKVEKTEFLWENARKRSYYWRVAAGGKKGRMGVFSEPALLEESAVVVSPEPEPVPISEPSPPSPEPEKVAEIEEPPPAPPPPHLHEPKRLRFFWKPGQQSVTGNAERNVDDVSLSGMNLSSVSFETDAMRKENHWWRWSAQYSQNEYEPYPKHEYPFQDNVTFTNARASATFVRPTSAWAFGASVRMLPEVLRTGFESIEVRNQLAMDMHLQGLWRFSFIEYRMEFSAIGGGSGFGLGTVQRFVANPFGGFLTGFEIDASYILNGSFHTLTTETSLLLGYEF